MNLRGEGAVVFFASESPAWAETNPPQLKDLKDKASYSIGLNIGFNLKRQNVELNQDAFLAGMKDALNNRKPALSEQEVRETMMAFEKDIQGKQQERAKKNQADAVKYLTENKRRT